jgi:hypothetical protein
MERLRQPFRVSSMLIAGFVLTLTLVAFKPCLAEECFNSSKKINDDAQTIRLKAMDMGWKVSNSASIAAAGIVRGKTEIYPKDNVEICLREEERLLKIRAQSKSKDAGKAGWHRVIAKKKLR